jgi:hypothetical protein
MIQLTDEQRAAVEKGDAVRVLAPDLGREVVVLRADRFETLQELLPEENERQATARIAMKNAIARMSEPS